MVAVALRWDLVYCCESPLTYGELLQLARSLRDVVKMLGEDGRDVDIHVTGTAPGDVSSSWRHQRHAPRLHVKPSRFGGNGRRAFTLSTTTARFATGTSHVVSSFFRIVIVLFYCLLMAQRIFVAGRQRHSYCALPRPQVCSTATRRPRTVTSLLSNTARPIRRPLRRR